MHNTSFLHAILNRLDGPILSFRQSPAHLRAKLEMYGIICSQLGAEIAAEATKGEITPEKLQRIIFEEVGKSVDYILGIADDTVHVEEGGKREHLIALGQKIKEGEFVNPANPLDVEENIRDFKILLVERFFDLCDLSKNPDLSRKL